MGSLQFRAGTVAVVSNSKGRVLAFQRTDFPGQWQLPQGGIDWTVYEWPDGVKRGARLGQAQRWFFFEARDDEVEPTPDGEEFDDWKWVKVPWLVDQVVEFRKPSYQRVLGARS